MSRYSTRGGQDHTAPTVYAIRRLAGVLEQEIQRFLGLDMGGDPAQRAIFLKPHLHGRDRLPLLPGQPLHLPIHFVARGVDGFPLRDPATAAARP